MGTTPADVMNVGFAKLKGKDFEFYIQTYSILLGRSSKNFTIDVDLSCHGTGKSISRRHVRIFYDFTCRCFAMEVLSMNGCLVEGVLHRSDDLLVKLNSQDHIYIGKTEFYFLLPSMGIPFRPLVASNGEGVVEADSTHDLSSPKKLHCEADENCKTKEEKNDRSGDNRSPFRF